MQKAFLSIAALAGIIAPPMQMHGRRYGWLNPGGGRPESWTNPPGTTPMDVRFDRVARRKARMRLRKRRGWH